MFLPSLLDFEKKIDSLPFHSWMLLVQFPILSAYHLQGPKSKIYVHFPLSKQAINWDFIHEVKLSIKHVINLEVQSITKSSILCILI